MAETRAPDYSKNLFFMKTYNFEYFLQESGGFSSLYPSQLFKIDFCSFQKVIERKCCKMICHMLYFGWNNYPNVLRSSKYWPDIGLKSSECDDFISIFTEIVEWYMSFYSRWVLFRQWTQGNTIMVSLYAN